MLLLPLRSLPGALFSFEALLVLYLFAGIYKGDPRLAGVPFDITAALFAATMVVGAFILVRGPNSKASVGVVFAVLCLVVWLAVTLGWSPSRQYGPDKVFLLATLVMWATTAAALIVAPSPERTARFLTLLLLFALWPAIDALMIFFGAQGKAGLIHLASLASYQQVGRVCGLAAVVALLAWLYGRGATAWLWLLVFGLLGFVLAVAGGRGPLLATILPVLLLVLLGIRFTRTRLLYWPAHLAVLLIVGATVTGTLAYAQLTDSRLMSVERLTPLLSGQLGRSAGTRADHYGDTLTLAAQAPVFGHGVGSWPMLHVGLPDAMHYPHNLFAELLVEGGIVAVLLFVVVLRVAFRGFSFERMRSDPQAMCAVLLFCNAFLNAMVSADLPGNRTLFFTIGLLAMFAVRRRAVVL